MSNTARFSGTQALLRAYRASQSVDPSRLGYCLREVRTWCGIPAKYDEADDAWLGARKRHTNGEPPAGAAVFWLGGQHGHVALSAGDGYVWTTDIAGAGHVSKERIERIHEKWKYQYVGWTEDLNGYLLNLVAQKAKISLAEVEYCARYGKLVRGSTERMPRVFQSLRQLDCGDATPATFRAVWKNWQLKLGYKGADADGIPGAASVAALAEQCGYVVIP